MTEPSISTTAAAQASVQSAAAPRPIRLLLIEPNTVLRRTVALTLRALGTAQVSEAASYGMARQLVQGNEYDAMVLALDHVGEIGRSHGLALVQSLRCGETRCADATPIAVLADCCDSLLLQVLREIGVTRVLLKPFRARDVIDTVALLAAAQAVTATLPSRTASA